MNIWLLPRNLAIAVMKVYRKVISPLYGQVCKYYPSCSRYALEAYQLQGFVRGTLLTVWRVLRCNPWSHGGVDDPPVSANPELIMNSHGFIVWRAQPEHTSSDQTKDVIH